MIKVTYVLVGVAVVATIVAIFWPSAPTVQDELVACSKDAMICPDGTTVGREAPDCAFAACPAEPVPTDVQAEISAKVDTITVTTPTPGSYIVSPLTIVGEARGTWFFEGDFPVMLTNWDGEIIAEHYATAQNDWMTEDFVPFTTELTFESSYQSGDPDFMQQGWLILQRDNPTGLPEHDDALEIPVWFATQS